MDTFFFSTQEKVYELFPYAKFAAILLTNLKPKKSITTTDIITRIKSNASEELLRLSEEYYNNSNYIVSWINAFNQLHLNKRDFTPAHVALIRRVFKQKRLPDINSLVDIYNSVSLVNLLPIGGHDISNKGSIRIAFTNGTEKFQSLDSDKAEVVLKDELAYIDDKDQVLTRHLVWRQSKYSMVTDKSTSVFIPLDDITGLRTDEEIAFIANQLVELLSQVFDFEYQIRIVNKYNPNTVFDHLRKFDQKHINNNLLVKRAKVITDAKLVDKFFDRKLDLIYPATKEFKQALLSGKRLRFYIGADATASQLHLGHLIPVLKMKQLQELGHEIIFLIGDFTAQIGDPTDKTATRTMLSEAQVAENAQSFKNQIAKYIDFDSEVNPARLEFNSRWNKSLTFTDVIHLSAQFTVQQMIERDMFQVRLKENKPIYLHEFLYPLMQGYDSVVMGVDGEFGGRDQTFNMLAGRSLTKNLKQINKYVITTHFLLAADGKSKMSKSIGNCIFINDSPQDKFGKVMSIPDDLISHYYKLATFVDDKKIAEIEKDLTGKGNPMEHKKNLAYEIVLLNDGEKAATEAKEYFEKTIQNGEIPFDAEKITKDYIKEAFPEKEVSLKRLLTFLNLTKSNSDSERLIASNAVEVYTNNSSQILNDPQAFINIEPLSAIKVGKRKWIVLL